MATFDNMHPSRQHTNTYVVWSDTFDRATSRLGISECAFFDLTEPLVAALVDDAYRFPPEPGTSYRLAPLTLPDRTVLRIRYRVTEDRGGTRVELCDVTVPDRVVAP